MSFFKSSEYVSRDLSSAATALVGHRLFVLVSWVVFSYATLVNNKFSPRLSDVFPFNLAFSIYASDFRVK